MMKSNIIYPSTSNNVLNKIVKEYLELRHHEFNTILEKYENKEKGHFYNDYQFHQFSKVSSINLFLYYGYKENQIFLECISFHLLNNSPIRIDDLISLESIKNFLNNINECDYNNFYLSEYGIHFISILKNKIIENFIEYKYINFKINP